MLETIDYNTSLRSDVKMLGNLLGEILVFHGGQELFDKVETIREMTKSIRNEFDKDTYMLLKKEIKSLEPPMRQQVIRAFSVYFHLVNIAEQNHRIRRRRQYLLKEGTSQPFSLEKAVTLVKEYSLSEDDIQDVLDDLTIELIMTAHPTEATKRTVLEIQKRISENLGKLDNPLATDREKEVVTTSLLDRKSVV